MGRLCRQGPLELRGRPARTPGKASVVARMIGEAATGGCAGTLAPMPARYSRIAADLGFRVLAFDMDPAAAERHYRALRPRRADRHHAAGHGPRRPQPGRLVGRTRSEPACWSVPTRTSSWRWRSSTTWRSAATCRCRWSLDLFARLAPEAIVEWVPRGDPMVQRMLLRPRRRLRSIHERGIPEARRSASTSSSAHRSRAAAGALPPPPPESVLAVGRALRGAAVPSAGGAC